MPKTRQKWQMCSGLGQRGIFILAKQLFRTFVLLTLLLSCHLLRHHLQLLLRRRQQQEENLNEREVEVPEEEGVGALREAKANILIKGREKDQVVAAVAVVVVVVVRVEAVVVVATVVEVTALAVVKRVLSVIRVAISTVIAALIVTTTATAP